MVKPKTAIKSIMREWHARTHTRTDAIDFHIVIAIIKINVGHYSYRDVHFMSKLSIGQEDWTGKRARVCVSEWDVYHTCDTHACRTYIIPKPSDVNDLEIFHTRSLTLTLAIVHFSIQKAWTMCVCVCGREYAFKSSVIAWISYVHIIGLCG